MNLFDTLKKNEDEEILEDKKLFDKYTKIIYSEARTIAGLPVENPVEITKLIVDIISK